MEMKSTKSKYLHFFIETLVAAPFIIWFLTFVAGSYEVKATVNSQKDDIKDIKTDVRDIKKYLMEHKKWQD